MRRLLRTTTYAFVSALLLGACGPRRPAAVPVATDAQPTTAPPATTATDAPPATRPTASTSIPAATPSFAPFVGDWGAHGASLTIRADGAASAVWRTYRWCSEDPRPPCDRTEGNAILSGGNATFRLDAVEGSVAKGIVTSTTDTTIFPLGGRVEIALLKGDMISVEPSGMRFCGPNAAPMSCGA